MLLQITAQQMAHFGKLGKDQRPIIDGQNLVQHLHQATEFAAACLFAIGAVLLANLMQELGGMVTNLL